MSRPTLYFVEYIINKFPLKKLCILAVFVPFVLMTVNIHYVSNLAHNPSRMCSSLFPGYARPLDLPVTLADGAIQAGARVFPPGAVWQKDGVVRGCPCNVGICIRPCCHDGLYLYVFEDTKETHIECRVSDQRKFENTSPIWVSSRFDPNKRVTVQETHFSFLAANCHSWRVKTNISLAHDGTIFAFGRFFPAAITDICFASRENKLISNVTYNCLSPVDENRTALLIRQYTIAAVTAVIAASLNVLTLVVYCLVPALRAADYGLSLMCYALATFLFKVGYISDIVVKYYGWTAMIVCVERVSISLGTVVLSWQFVISWQMWQAFKPGSLRMSSNVTGYKKFVLYSVLFWGAGIAVIGVETGFPGYNINYYLMTVLALATLWLNVATLRRVNVCLRESKRIRGPESRTHNVKECLWASVFVKVSLITGIDFTVGNLYNFIYIIVYGEEMNENSFFRYLVAFHASVNALKGVEIFYFNIWQTSTWTLLKHRIYSK